MENKKLRALICTAMLAALSIVLGKLLAINIGDTWRISFENLPLMLASVIFGPVYGGACGLVADLVGCLIRGYAINPLITLASVVMGIIPGFFVSYIFRSHSFPHVIISCMISHVVCSMALKTFALHVYYMTPYSYLLATRIPTYIVVGALESVICAILANIKPISREMDF